MSSMPEEYQSHLLEGVLDCLICSNSFSPDPQSCHKAMTVPCGHRLCNQCADMLIMNFKRDGQHTLEGFSCPVCRRFVNKNNLKPCSFISDVLKRHQDRVIPKRCKLCKKRRRGVEFTCTKCGKPMCKVCADRHEHQSCERVAEGTLWNVLYCQKHNKEVLFYCRLCKAGFCTLEANPPKHKHKCISVTDQGFLDETEEKLKKYKEVLVGARQLLASDIQELQSHSDDVREFIKSSLVTLFNEITLESVLNESSPGDTRRKFFRYVVDEVSSLTVKMLQAKLDEVKYVQGCLRICKDCARGVVLRRLLDEILEPEIEKLHADIDIKNPDKIQERLKGRNVIKHILSRLNPDVISKEFLYYCLDNEIEISRTPRGGNKRFFGHFGWDETEEYILPDYAPPLPHLLKASAEVVTETFLQFLRNKNKEEITSCCMGFYRIEEDHEEKLVIDVLSSNSANCPNWSKVNALVNEFLEMYEAIPEDGIIVNQQETSFREMPHCCEDEKQAFARVVMFNETGRLYVAVSSQLESEAVLHNFPVNVRVENHPAEKSWFLGCHGFRQPGQVVEDIANNDHFIVHGQAVSIGVLGPLETLELGDNAEKAMIEGNVGSLIGAPVYKAGACCSDSIGRIKSVGNYVPLCLSNYLCAGAVEVFLEDGELERMSLAEGDVLCHRESADTHTCSIVGVVCKIQKDYIAVSGDQRTVDRVICALMSNNLQALELHHSLQFKHFMIDTPPKSLAFERSRDTITYVPVDKEKLQECTSCTALSSGEMQEEDDET